MAEEQINGLKVKKKFRQTSIRRLHKFADNLSVQAEKELKMELHTNLNAFRTSAKDKEAEVLQLDKQIKRKTEELKQYYAFVKFIMKCTQPGAQPELL